MRYKVNPKLPRYLEVLEHQTEQTDHGVYLTGTLLLRDHSEYPSEPGHSELLLLTQPAVTSFHMGMECGLEDFCDRGNKRSLCKGVDFRAGDLT
ncbi:hypothetical protein LTS12_023365, partial [Elasticomyces elasticus]